MRPHRKTVLEICRKQNNLAALIEDNMPGDPLLARYITRIGKSLKKSNKKNDKLVALSYACRIASPERLEHPEKAFDAKHVVELDTLSMIFNARRYKTEN